MTTALFVLACVFFVLLLVATLFTDTTAIGAASQLLLGLVMCAMAILSTIQFFQT